jgi:hypothetical protein
MAYNAAVYHHRGGRRAGIFMAEVDGDGRMLRANAFIRTGLEGTPRYDEYLHTWLGGELTIIQDGCAGSRRWLLAFG